jgi:hypothetical protein
LVNKLVRTCSTVCVRKLMYCASALESLARSKSSSVITRVSTSQIRRVCRIISCEMRPKHG